MANAPDKPSHQDDTYSDEETERRVNDALRRALNTPPHHKPAKTIKPKDSRAATKDRGSKHRP
jgi:hypothetical protein